MTKQKEAEDFVYLWMKAKAQDKGEAWVGEMLGVTRQAVEIKANRLRVRGVKLPTLKSTRQPLDLNIDKLNKRIDRMYVKV